MKQKYHTYTATFTVDTEFQRYYASFANAETEHKKKIKKDLKGNVRLYFEEILQEF